MTFDIGPERIVLTDGLQPFGFKTQAGTVVVQAQLSIPPSVPKPAKNAYPGLPGTVVSRDGGRSWTHWRPAADQGDGPLIEGAVTQLRDGTILLLNWIADEPGTDGRSWTGKLWESRDDFRTVTGPVPFTIDMPQAKTGYDDGGHPYSGITFHRTLLELPGGDLLATVYCWFAGDDTPCPYQPRMCKFRTVLLRSADRGRSWRYVSTVAVDPSVGEEGFDEPVMVRMSAGPHPGRLLCLMRTGSNDCPLYQAVSDDEGRSWTPPRALPLHGVDPDLIEIPDGTLVAAFGRRVLRQPLDARGYCLAVSHDAGDSWPQVVRLPPTEPAALTMALKSDDDIWAAGNCVWTHYTTLLQVAPDALLLLYDVGLWDRTVRYIASRRITFSR